MVASSLADDAGAPGGVLCAAEARTVDDLNDREPPPWNPYDSEQMAAGALVLGGGFVAALLTTGLGFAWWWTR